MGKLLDCRSVAKSFGLVVFDGVDETWTDGSTTAGFTSRFSPQAKSKGISLKGICAVRLRDLSAGGMVARNETHATSTTRFNKRQAPHGPNGRILLPCV